MNSNDILRKVIDLAKEIVVENDNIEKTLKGCFDLNQLRTKLDEIYINSGKISAFGRVAFEIYSDVYNGNNYDEALAKELLEVFKCDGGKCPKCSRFIAWSCLFEVGCQHCDIRPEYCAQCSRKDTMSWSPYGFYCAICNQPDDGCTT